MKWLSYILTVFVLLLAAQPTIALANDTTKGACCSSSCCGEQKEEPKDNKTNKKDCSTQNCNPFQSCGACIGFTVKNSLFKLSSPPYQKELPNCHVRSFISQYSPDFWQPPKIS